MDRLTILMTCILLLCAGTLKVRAQNDPVLAGMILLYTDKAQKELKSQEKVMLLQTTGHIWTKEEIEGTTDLQREFNDYLDSFRSIVCYAAQTYGFYHEISRACLSDNKMTEKERMEVVFGIRPKLKLMNKKLQRLTIAVKYTTMGDIWIEIDGGSVPVADKRDIVEAAQRRWRQNGRKVRP